MTIAPRLSVPPYFFHQSLFEIIPAAPDCDAGSEITGLQFRKTAPRDAMHRFGMNRLRGAVVPRKVEISWAPA
jgi:hypothetical protein